VFIVLTGLYEHRITSPYAMFPHAVMANLRGFGVICGVALLSGILYYSTLIVFPLQISILWTQNPTYVGLYSTAYGWGSLVGAFVVGFILKRFDIARWMLIGTCVMLTNVIGARPVVGKCLKPRYPREG